LAISKQRKDEILQEYLDMLANAKGVVITEYRGMTVKQLDVLRAKLREAKSGFAVTKNTIFKIALKQVGMAVPEDQLVGPVAVAIAYDDLATTIKTVLDQASSNDIFIVKGGIVGATAVRGDQLEAVSQLPSIDVLRAQLLGMVTMPLTQLVGLLEEPSRGVVAVIRAGTDGLVNVLAAYVQKDAA